MTRIEFGKLQIGALFMFCGPYIKKNLSTAYPLGWSKTPQKFPKNQQVELLKSLHIKGKEGSEIRLNW